MITIIDYGVGNIAAFQNVYNRLNIPVNVAKNLTDLDGSDKLILPGVGSFDYAMSQLNNSGMREKLDHLVLKERIPVIGICVGMQMMGFQSEEGNLRGLSWIDAKVCKFDESKIKYRTKLPHMGWNNVNPIVNHPLFDGLGQDSLFYFLHSFYVECNYQNNIMATTNYGKSFASVIEKDNIFGVQFHPEKSHSYGERLLKNFANL